MRPRFAFIFRPKEGVGNAGCPLHPQPRVHFVLVERTRVTTSTPESPGIPARNGFNGVCRALPGDRALLPTVVSGLRFCPRPVGPTNLRELDASVGASGPHDFAVRVSAVRLLAQVSLTGLSTRPAIPSRANAAASTASHPASVTIAIRPLCGEDEVSSRDDLGWVKTEIFFGKSEIGLDTPVDKPPDGQIT